MILTGNEIQRQYDRGGIHIDPFDPSRINPNSYDLTLSPTIGIAIPGVLDMKKEQTLYLREIDPHDGMMLVPGVLYLGQTNEQCGSDTFVTCLEGRSSVGRLGIQVHLTAGFGDLGFKSRWTLEIVVVQPVIVYPNVRICQAIFYAVQGTIGDRLYRGKYVTQTGPTPSKMWTELTQ